MLASVDLDRACDLAPETHFGKGLVERNTGAAVQQRVENLGLTVSETRHRTQPRHDDTSHTSAPRLSEGVCRSEQTDAQIFCRINLAPVDGHRAICNCHDQLA